MDNKELEKEFQQIEDKINQGIKNNEDVSDLLRKKARLLNIGYKNFSENLKNDNVKMIAPLYAQKLAFLNNIKRIQIQIKDDVSATEREIKKIHESMRNDGLGWILDNLPEKKG